MNDDDLYAHEREHYVYRLFDKSDRLLYIGCARDVEERIYMHRATFTMACSWEIHLNYHHHTSEPYPDLAAAREAERHAITTEAPLLNRQHNPTRWRRISGAWTPVGDTATEIRETTEANRPPVDPELVAMLSRATGAA